MSEIALRKVSKKNVFVYVWLWKTPVYLLCFKVVKKPSLESDLSTTAKDTNVTKTVRSQCLLSYSPLQAFINNLSREVTNRITQRHDIS